MSTSTTGQRASEGFPAVDQSQDGSGTAAIGQTTTYSSQPLASGDPTGRIVDHSSKDPMTYKMPEVGHASAAAKGPSDRGVTSPAASAAASAAWAAHNKGEIPLLLNC